jgi:predicted MFS family arabinose efflux permease
MIELRSPQPLVDLRIFRRRLLRGANLVGLIEFGAGAGFFFTSSLMMQRVFHYSPLETGFAYLPIAIAVLAGAQAASRLATRVHPRHMVLGSLPVAAMAFVLIARAPDQPTFWIDLLGPFVLFGFFLGAMFVPIQILAFSGTTPQETGLAAGLINTCQEVGGAIGVAILSTVAVSRTNHLTGPGDAATIGDLHSGYRYALLVDAALLLLALTIAIVLFTNRSSPAEDDDNDELDPPELAPAKLGPMRS